MLRKAQAHVGIIISKAVCVFEWVFFGLWSSCRKFRERREEGWSSGKEVATGYWITLCFTIIWTRWNECGYGMKGDDGVGDREKKRERGYREHVQATSYHIKKGRTKL